MSHDVVPTAPDPARAFEDLRAEVSLLRRAIQGLTAERQNAPDYLPTLQDVAAKLALIARTVDRVAKAPAMELTVESLASRIEAASEQSRVEARRLVQDANAATHASLARIDAVVERGWTAERQWRQLLWTAAVAFGLGIILCAALPHTLKRGPPRPSEGVPALDRRPPVGRASIQ